MRIAITGSRGLLGRALHQALAAARADVVEFDIARDETEDVRDAAAVARLVADCDGVVHFAAISRVPWAEADPDAADAVNVGGTANVVAAAEASPRRPWVLYASSREVYGPRDDVVSETDPLNPINVYARGKVAAERRVGGSDARAAIVRFSNVYGAARDHLDRVVPAFVRAALNGETLRVEGAENAFDFVYIDDAVAAVMGIIARLNDPKRPPPPPLHVVTGVSTTLQSLAERAISAADASASQIRYAPERPYDVRVFRGNPDQAARELGWRARVPLDQGLALLVDKLGRRQAD